MYIISPVKQQYLMCDLSLNPVKPCINIIQDCSITLCITAVFIIKCHNHHSFEIFANMYIHAITYVSKLS